MPFSKSMRDDHVAERTLFMRNAIRSPRYGVEYGANTCLILLICFAFAVICPLLPLFGGKAVEPITKFSHNISLNHNSSLRGSMQTCVQPQQSPR
jgi:hypothetical protein